jgi:helix-turn-helix protein/integrase-like protein
VRIFGFIAAKKAEHSIKIMCRVLEVSRSGFHAWAAREPSARAVADTALTGRIAEIHAESRKTYGSPRVHAELRLEDGVRVGRKRVERLMRHAGLAGQVTRRRGKTTIRVQGVRTAPDLVERDFNPTTINRLWSADITYIRTWEGWLYLASVMDLYSRRIVGWALADHLRAELVVDALEMAVSRRRPGAGLVHHSDQGSLGGFKWSLQRPEREGLRWDSRGGVGRIGWGGRRCVPLVDLRWRGVSIGSGSGRRSQPACRAIRPARTPACHLRLASDGFVRVAGCRRSAGRRCRDATCRSPSARRSRS